MRTTLSLSTRFTQLMDNWMIHDWVLLSDPLGDAYTEDPHMASVLTDIYELISPRMRSGVYIAGGFVSHLAGITKEHGDVDIFCTHYETFERVLTSIKTNLSADSCRKMTRVKTNNGYGQVVKFSYNGVKYDIIDAGVALDGVDKPCLFGIFDIAWSMTMIDLADQTIICHPAAFLPEPKINKFHINNHNYGTIRRIAKYSNRLVRAPNKKECKRVAKILKKRMRILKKTKEQYDAWGY